MNTSCENYQKCQAEDFLVCSCQQQAQTHEGLSDEDKKLLIWESYRGLALYAAKHFIGKALYDHDEQRWRIYEDGVWVSDAESQFTKMVEAVLLHAIEPLVTEILEEFHPDKLRELDEEQEKTLKAKKAAIFKQKEVINDPSKMAKVLTRMSSELHCVISKFDTSLNRVCLTNGVFDFDTLQLLPHSPAHMFTKRLSIAYDQKAKCPRWDDFLKLILRDKKDVIQYLQKIFGYCLTGHNSLQSLIFLHGGGGNGKTIVISVLKELLGDQNAGYYFQFNTEQLLGKTKYGSDHSKMYTLAQLHGKRVICGTEVSNGMVLDATMVKDLTGGDSIFARSPGGKPFNYDPVFKVLLYGNHFPEINDTDDGIRRRIKLVKFDYSFKTEGAHLKREREEVMSEFREEMAGIFNWAVEGYRLYLTEKLNEPESVLADTQKYFNEEDIVQQFIEEACILEPGTRCKCSDLWSKFREWDKARQFVGGKSNFYRDIENRGYKKVQDNGLKQKVFFGIRIADGSELFSTPSYSLDNNVFPPVDNETPF